MRRLRIPAGACELWCSSMKDSKGPRLSAAAPGNRGLRFFTTVVLSSWRFSGLAASGTHTTGNKAPKSFLFPPFMCGSQGVTLNRLCGFVLTRGQGEMLVNFLHTSASA